MSKKLLGLCIAIATLIQISAEIVDPRPLISAKSREHRALVNSSHTLECKVEGNTPMFIYWKINNTKFDSEIHNRHSIETFKKRGYYGDYTLTTLNITKIERSDSGVFTCVATNSFEQASLDINLLVQEPPEAPHDLKVLTNFDKTLQFSWKKPYDGNSPITMYVVEYKLNTQSWEDCNSFWVDDTQAAILAISAVTYDIRVKARNSVGDSEFSEILSVFTPKVVPDVPTDIRVETEDEHTLVVFWKPPPKDEWNVTVAGYQVGYRLTESEDPYDVLTVKLEQEAQEYHSKITNLETYTQYSVAVRAVNERGGKWSEEIKIYTEEGVPERAPKNPKCSGADSQSIYFVWRPVTKGANGVIIGYKVIFAPSETWLDENTRTKKVTTVHSTPLVNLQKYTNYTIQVSALTSKGDGPSTTPIVCQTGQSVPGRPASIKAIPSSSDTIIVAWKPPLERNGVIIYYTVYHKKEGDNPISHTVTPDMKLRDAVENLNSSLKYEFWVTAATVIGEGPPSEKVTATPSNTVPAQIATFGSTFTATYEENVVLPCPAVGRPPPMKIWQKNGVNITSYDYIDKRPDGSFFIPRVRRKDAGEYSCLADNEHGQDSVTYQLVVNGPPLSPQVRLVSSTTDSLTFDMKPDESDVKTIRKYVIHYKPRSGNWKSTEVLVPGKYTLEQLRCGTRYLLYVEAYNSFGKGEPSDILSTRTRGHKPVVPTGGFVEAYCHNITLRLNAWSGGGCPISNFTIEHKRKDITEWIEQTFDVNLEGNFVFLDLEPGVAYELRVTAWNDAGFSKFITKASTRDQHECNFDDASDES